MQKTKKKREEKSNSNVNKQKLKQIKKKKLKEKKNIEKELKRQEKEHRRELKRQKETKKKIKKYSKTEVEKRRKRNNKIKFVGLGMLVITSIILLLLSPIFNIRDIEVIGNKKITKNEIISLLQIPENTNIFKETNSIIEKKLKENPYIDSVIVTRKLPSLLSLNIKERTVDYVLEFGSSYAYINKAGYILEISTILPEGKVKIQGYETSIESIISGNRLCEDDLKKLNTVIQIMQTATSRNIEDLITSINIKDDNNYKMYLESEQKTVYLGNKTSLDIKMLHVQAILEKERGNVGEIHVDRDLNNQKSYFTPAM